jgi:hypothetical protein
MPFCSLNEGHYRALEKSLSELVDKLDPRYLTALVTAGEVQAGRLRSFLSANREVPLAGIDVLPGILHLAARLSDTPVFAERISPADRTATAMKAMSSLEESEPYHGTRGNISSAASLGGFFEKLLEQGIDPDMYSICSEMTSADPGPVEQTTGRLFQLYTETRNELYPSSPDRIIASSPGRNGRYSTLLFFGFYDLNPAQRRFTGRLRESGADVHWFSPVHPSSRWRAVYGRTGDFLRDLGFRERNRVDWNFPHTPAAAAAESLLGGSGPVPDPDVLRITAAAGDIGAAREVLRRISDLVGEGMDPRRIAVVTRRPDDSLVARLAHHEGLPVSAPLTTPLSDLPIAGLAAAIAQLPEDDFHYSSLETLVTTGMLDPDLDPGERGIRKAVNETGVRSGLDNWRAALGEQSGLRRLIDVLGDFFDSRGVMEAPLVSLAEFRELLCAVSRSDPGDPLLDLILPAPDWRSREPVDWRTFAGILRQHLGETDAALRDGDRDGFSVLSLEKMRGSLWDAVIIMDLEEGIFPSVQIDDPRLSAELRSALQLPDPCMREAEEAFLLSQAMEASSGSIDLVYRYLDSSGRPLNPSPFIAEAVSAGQQEGSGCHFSRKPSSP